jgi:hypothetical protein
MKHTTQTPCFEVLGDLGSDVRRVGRLSSGLWVDALKPGLVGAGGVTLVAVGGDAAGGHLGDDAASNGDAAPKLPLEAEPVRARLCECVSYPAGELIQARRSPAGRGWLWRRPHFVPLQISSFRVQTLTHYKRSWSEPCLLTRTEGTGAGLI